MITDLNIYEGFLSDDLSVRIFDALTDGAFPWFYNQSTYIKDYEVRDIGIDSFQFTHTFYREGGVKSESFNIISPIVDKIKNILSFDIESRLIRAKANFVTPQPRFSESDYHPPHIDNDKNHMSLLYYANDSDGSTYFFNETDNVVDERFTERLRTNPSRNKSVLFNSNIYHASSPPITSDYRLVVNIVFRCY